MNDFRKNSNGRNANEKAIKIVKNSFPATALLKKTSFPRREIISEHASSSLAFNWVFCYSNNTSFSFKFIYRRYWQISERAAFLSAASNEARTRWFVYIVEKSNSRLTYHAMDDSLSTLRTYFIRMFARYVAASDKNKTCLARIGESSLTREWERIPAANKDRMHRDND